MDPKKLYVGVLLAIASFVITAAVSKLSDRPRMRSRAPEAQEQTEYEAESPSADWSDNDEGDDFENYEESSRRGGFSTSNTGRAALFGRIVGPGAEPGTQYEPGSPNRVSLVQLDSDTSAVPREAQLDNEFAFELSGLDDGEYELAVLDSESRVLATRPTQVREGRAANLEIYLELSSSSQSGGSGSSSASGNGELAGHIKAPTAGEADDIGAFWVTVLESNDPEGEPLLSAMTEADGYFELSNLQRRGKAILMCGGFNFSQSTWALSAQEIDLAQSQPLKVSLDGPQISGRVLSGDQPSGFATVRLSVTGPGDGVSKALAKTFEALSDREGRFEVFGLPPATYTFYSEGPLEGQRVEARIQINPGAAQKYDITLR